AAAKSLTNASLESLHAYTSEIARSWEFEPKRRSTRVPVHLISPVARSLPSNTPSDAEEACHFVLMSSRLTKKSFVNVPGRLVKTPFLDCPKFVFKARMS